MLLKKQTKKYYNNLDYKVNLNNYDLVFKFKIIQLKNKEKNKKIKTILVFNLKKIFFQIDYRYFYFSKLFRVCSKYDL